MPSIRPFCYFLQKWQNEIRGSSAVTGPADFGLISISKIAVLSPLAFYGQVHLHITGKDESLPYLHGLHCGLA